MSQISQYLLYFFSSSFILFELVRLIRIEAYWKRVMNSDFKVSYIFIELVYFIFLIALLFTQFWLLGLSVIALSVLTGVGVNKNKKNPLNNKIRTFIILDAVISILAFAVIIMKLNSVQ